MPSNPDRSRSDDAGAGSSDPLSRSNLHSPPNVKMSRADTVDMFTEEIDPYARDWMFPEENNENHYARAFMFGDFHADTHSFIEKATSRAPKEVACAAAASALVSPLVSIIDKCLVQDIAGTSQFLKAVSNATKEMVLTPKTFFSALPFRLTFAVYFGTYAVANLTELAMDKNNITKDDQRKTIKVGASGLANIGLLLWRDSIFARMYSNSPPRAIPMRTLGLFAARDMSTMYATFYLAPLAAEYLEKNHGIETNIAELSSALAIPAAIQVVTAPFHIHAMDFYSRPSTAEAPITNADRWGIVRKEFKTVSFARSFRILPAFGIGSFSNNKFREWFIRQENEDLLLQRQLTRAFTSMRN
mmetsp:Transcript_21709/g.47318  ORF Transcript_21709/g.47318 Transcript_21709/m.47318 type:complete len:359 (+) Transcript_21709:263-1339(+)